MSDDQHLTFGPELKAKWLIALRSGAYSQGAGTLYKDGNYCCLGVLAAVYGIPDENLLGVNCLGEINGTLANSIGGNDIDREIQCKLENMNDGTEGERRHSFDEIADYIEANL